MPFSGTLQKSSHQFQHFKIKSKRIQELLDFICHLLTPMGLNIARSRIMKTIPRLILQPLCGIPRNYQSLPIITTNHLIQIFVTSHNVIMKNEMRLLRETDFIGVLVDMQNYLKLKKTKMFKSFLSQIQLLHFKIKQFSRKKIYYSKLVLPIEVCLTTQQNEIDSISSNIDLIT